MLISRRTILGTGAVGVMTAAAAQAQNAATPEPIGRGRSGTDIGPRDVIRDKENPDMLTPPTTDSGTLPNLRFSYADAHNRLARAGWARQITVRELAVSEPIAGVNMRLNAGGVRELHWHKAAEWAYMLKGTARITAIDPEGRNFVDDVEEGDLWYFASGIPHSIQGLNPDGCEFLLAFDDGNFSEDNTFLISDWFKHTPREILAKNFGVPEATFDKVLDSSQGYIFPAPLPGPLSGDRIPGVTSVPNPFSHKMLAQEPIKTRSGTVRITDSKNFPASVTIAAALVEVAPGGLREMHWHPNADEWQYYIAGEGRMTCASAPQRAPGNNCQAAETKSARGSGMTSSCRSSPIALPSAARCGSAKLNAA